MVNVPLLRKVLEHITEHPDEHDQRKWAIRGGRGQDCGTAMCVAGHAVAMTGHEIAWPTWNDNGNGYNSSVARHTRDRGSDGWPRSIEDVAREELGLSQTESEWLFMGSNTLRVLWCVANRFSDGEIEVPERFL